MASCRNGSWLSRPIHDQHEGWIWAAVVTRSGSSLALSQPHCPVAQVTAAGCGPRLFGPSVEASSVVRRLGARANQVTQGTHIHTRRARQRSCRTSLVGAGRCELPLLLNRRSLRCCDYM